MNLTTHCCECCKLEDAANLRQSIIEAALQYAIMDCHPAVDDDCRAAAVKLLKKHFDAETMPRMPM